MAIQRWHRGKLIILWAWGSLAVALILAWVVPIPKQNLGIQHFLAFVLVLLLLLILSGITWYWLGGREAEKQPYERQER